LHTLATAKYLAEAKKTMGYFLEAEALFRKTLAGARLVHGETHLETLECNVALAKTLVCQNKVDEARELHRQVLPVALRVLGPHHFVSTWMQEPRFLGPFQA